MNSSKTKIGYFQEEAPLRFVQFSELISALKPFINVTRFFGIPAFSVVENVISKGGICTFFGFLNLFFLANHVTLFALRLGRGEDFIKVSGPSLIIRLYVICVHVWCVLFSMKLAKVLRESLVVENRINKVYNGKTFDFIHPWLLRRKCLICAILFVAIGLGLTGKVFPVDVFVGGVSVSEAWEMFGEQHCGISENFFLHSSIVSSYCLFMELATNCVWLFGDIFLIILSIVMSELFNRINERGIKRVNAPQLTAVEIDLIREHHGLVSKLVKDLDDAVSALNLISLVLNVAFLIVGAYSAISLRARDRERMKVMLVMLYCNLCVCAVKLSLGLIAASILHHNAHRSLSDVRSWPMAREFQDFAINNGRAAVIHAFLGQLSKPNIGFTIGKLATITPKFLAVIMLGVAIFVVFARITISSCTRLTSRG